MSQSWSLVVACSLFGVFVTIHHNDNSTIRNILTESQALLSLPTLILYFITSRTKPQLWKFLSLLMLEFVGLVIWLATCAALAAVYDVLLSYGTISRPESWGDSYEECYDDDECYQFHDFIARDTKETLGRR